MALELKVPEVGESITEVMIGAWKKREGDAVALDESIVEIESDKATVELPAPAAGTVSRILKASGEKAVVGEVIGYLEPAGAAAAAPQPATPPVVDVKRTGGRTDIGSVQPAPPPPAQPRVMPAAARVLGEAGLPAAAVAGTGPPPRPVRPPPRPRRPRGPPRSRRSSRSPCRDPGRNGRCSSPRSVAASPSGSSTPSSRRPC
jgi:2-oxoglutarate dehydrogenase E2 component (dihydrolipoamide succinyltransferase)